MLTLFIKENPLDSLIYVNTHYPSAFPIVNCVLSWEVEDRPLDRGLWLLLEFDR